MSQQNTALIDDIMAALDAESSQNVELIVRNTQNGATKKMALASLEQIIYSYLTTAPVVTNLASVLGGLIINKTAIAGNDANNFEAGTGYRLSGGLNVAHKPSNPNRMVIYTYADDSAAGATKFQIACIADGSIAAREYDNGNWKDWSMTPSYLNAYPNLSSLASALGVSCSYATTLNTSYQSFKVDRLPALVHIYWIYGSSTINYEHIYIVYNDNSLITLKDSDIFEVAYSNGYLSVKSKEQGAYGAAIFIQ